MTKRPYRGRSDLGRFERVGAERVGWRDVYHTLMTIPVPMLLVVVGGAYLLANVFFALGYLLTGGIANARPGSFADAFFFSIQTMATIGYGNMYPQSLGANLLVTGESVYALLNVALSTGVMFARVSRPSARITFSRVAVIGMHDGRRVLMFRVANQRRNQIVEARMSVFLLRDETTVEGHRMRRFHDLALSRSHTPVFSLSWTVFHPIEPGSPLHGLDAEALKGQDALIVCSINGIDETFAQTIHARHAYGVDALRWDKRFVDIFVGQRSGRAVIDYTRFHEVAD